MFDNSSPSQIRLAGNTDPLLRPLTIKKLVLKNRIMSTSHASGLDSAGFPDDRYQIYHEEKAKGGLALTMFGGSSNVDIDSPNTFNQLNMANDAVIPYLQRFSERIHAHKCALMCQLTHLGRRGAAYGDHYLPTIAPSPIREIHHRSIPKEMDNDDILRVVKAFGQAARRCKEGGIDGIEVVGGAHLIGQFLSPRTNMRTDSYGGNLKSRCKFGLMVFEEMRREVGDDFLLGFRHVVDEGEGQDALRFDDSVAIAVEFQRAGYVDFFNALYGRFDTERGQTLNYMPGMESGIAPWLSVVGAFKREVALPVFHAARIADIATARHGVREGLLDMVGMTRPHIADPYIVKKLEAGEEHRIRPCVGATHCQSGHRPHCLHNPATGREASLSQIIEPAIQKLKVVIVGAGIAGIEAARICAERGHEIVIFEAASEPGGQLLLASASNWRKDVLSIVAWRLQELDRLGVSVRTNIFAESADILAEQPNVVILANGGIPNLPQFGGLECLTSPWDVIAGNISPGGRVLIYDGTGRHVAPQVVELLANRNVDVHLVSVDSQLCEELTYAERFAWKRRLQELNVEIVAEHEITSIEKSGRELVVDLRSIISGKAKKLSFDTVVADYGTLPMSDLFDELRFLATNNGVTDLATFVEGRLQPFGTSDGRFRLYRIGDAVSSRNVHGAILDAGRLCTRM